MKTFLIKSLLIFFIGGNLLFGQCDYIKPPKVKKIEYAKREITFSDVTINGQTTNVLNVRKNQPIVISTKITSSKIGNYCPGCIVQIYWGIRGYTSTCAKSFGGYNFSKIKSTHKFSAPSKDGIYYITMGGSLEYSCKNNKLRPECSADKAFAVLIVGRPNSTERITLNKIQKNNKDYLSSTVIKQGCFGMLNNINWSLNGRELPFNNQREIPLQKSGVYKVIWSNCNNEISQSFNHQAPIITNSEEIEEVKEDDIESLITKNDRVILKNLIFNQGKSYLKPQAKKELNQLAYILTKNPLMKIRLEGHTDYRGNARKNKKLSERRVKEARKYLVRNGIRKNRIKIKGMGEKKPLIINSDIEKCKINRRVEIVILSR